MTTKPVAFPDCATPEDGGKRRALLIDSAARTVSEVEIVGLEDMQRFVGGDIEVAFQWGNGDVLYVDEEGLLKPQEHWFAVPVERPDQPFAGNGLVVGREVEGDQYREGFTTLPPVITKDELTAKIVWRGAAEVNPRWKRG